MKIPRNLPVGTVFILRNGARRTNNGLRKMEIRAIARRLENKP